jgi:hypothetical protein
MYTRLGGSMCDMHVVQLLQTLPSLTAEHINSSLVEYLFSELVASSGGIQQQSPGPLNPNY